MTTTNTTFSYCVKTLHHGGWGYLPVVLRSDGRKRRGAYRPTLEAATKAVNLLLADWIKEDTK